MRQDEPRKIYSRPDKIAGLLLPTECLVTEIAMKEKSGSAPGGQGGMGGMDY
jgi:hypothetical protein